MRALPLFLMGLTLLPFWAAGESFVVVDTGQTRCYDNRNEIPPPQSGQPFYGQDAQFPRHPSRYTINADGLTVYDENTGLTWQRSPDRDGDGLLTAKDKLTGPKLSVAPAALNAARFGGYGDWRVPTIKELYSLFDARGTDPGGNYGTDTSRLTPFIDTKYFKFAYGDAGAGERIIDSQYASCTVYTGKKMHGSDKLFGVNFADGRIKGYDVRMPGGREKGFFVQCVRGNPQYGRNEFRDNGDGTITDEATALMWSKADSAKAMNWEAALAWVQQRNAERYLGHSDWRLPNLKELHSILDYARCPDATGSAAISPLFSCTSIMNEIGQMDFPYYWTGTTHAGVLGGFEAAYLAFGRAAGWMSPMPRQGGPPGAPPGAPSAQQARGRGTPQYVDVHGAGSQRSDPKAGDPAQYAQGRGPQGDIVRIYNYVRCVRYAKP